MKDTKDAHLMHLMQNTRTKKVLESVVRAEGGEKGLRNNCDS